jgi:hypothetical protein
VPEQLQIRWNVLIFHYITLSTIMQVIYRCFKTVLDVIELFIFQIQSLYLIL